MDNFDAAMQKVADAITGIGRCVEELHRLDIEEARIRAEFVGEMKAFAETRGQMAEKGNKP